MELDMEPPGRLPGGRTELPFAFVVEPIEGQELIETYHGVYVNVEYLCVDPSRRLRVPISLLFRVNSGVVMFLCCC